MPLSSSNELKTSLLDFTLPMLMTVYKPALTTFANKQNVSKGNSNVDQGTMIKSNLRASRLNPPQNGFQVHQKHYISKIKEISKEGSFKDFRSLRTQLSWATQLRLDIACSIAQAAQVTEDLSNSDPSKHSKGLNAMVKHLLTTTDQVLKFPKLDHKSLQLQVYSDALYGNNFDGSSQIGYIIFSADSNGNCQPLFWSSHKSKRFSRSVLGSETMAFADAFDMDYALNNDLHNMTSLDIPIIMLTDSRSLFVFITKAKTTSEKRLLIDVKVVKDAYQRNELHNIGFIGSEYNPADDLKSAKMKKMFQQSLLLHPIEQ